MVSVITLRFGLKLPDYGWYDERNKARVLKEMLNIYVHEKRKFAFYTYVCHTVYTLLKTHIISVRKRWKSSFIVFQ